jgi:glycine/D-amino acid oxidase-like deaminating enzyme
MAKEHIAVVGAGAFGGWTALMLLRKGFRVTLLDAWGAGNSHSTSGDETRVIRSVYTDEIYAAMASRSMQLWRENEAQFATKIFYNSGVLSLLGREDTRWRAAKVYFDQYQWPYQELSVKELQVRYPLVNFDNVTYGALELESGFLLARMGCHVVARAFVAEGGDYRIAHAKPSAIISEHCQGLILSDGTTLRADKYIFACGPWLGKIFPEEIGARIQSTRQDLYYFGVPAGQTALHQLPAWLDFVPNYQDTMMYGIPATGSDAALRGFKMGEDKAGPPFDPDEDDRRIQAAWLRRVRKYLAFRFPVLADAPLSESRVCQYENTFDAHFLIDQLPTANNVWIMGGGSGHGYKMGAALGEWMSQYMAGEVSAEPLFSFRRLRDLHIGVKQRR